MSRKLIKKFLNPSGPIEYYSGFLPEIYVQAPITNIGVKTTGVYPIETDLKRQDGRARVYRGHREGKDIYYLTSKNSDKIIGYTYNLPDKNGKWSWQGYLDYLDNYNTPAEFKPESGQFNRIHTERIHGIKTLNKKNPMYRGLTLNGNTDLSYAGTQLNNKNLADLGLGIRNVLNTVSSAMFMGGPSAVDNIFDLTDAFTNVAAGNWGMAGLSFGSALLPGISYGMSRIPRKRVITSENINNTIPEVSSNSTRFLEEPPAITQGEIVHHTTEDAILPAQQNVSENSLLPLNISNLELEGLSPDVKFRIMLWLNNSNGNLIVRHFTMNLTNQDLNNTIRHFGLEPTGDYLTDLDILDNIFIRYKLRGALNRNGFTTSSVKDLIIQRLLNSTNSPRNYDEALYNGILANQSEIPTMLEQLGLPISDYDYENNVLLHTYLNPTLNHLLVYRYVNSGNPILVKAFGELSPQYRPLPENLASLLENGRDWNPANNQLLRSAMNAGYLLPRTAITYRFAANANLPVEYAHINTYAPYTGEYPIEFFNGTNASTPEIARRYYLRAPEGNRANALKYNAQAAKNGDTQVPVNVFTEEDILKMTPELSLQLFKQAGHYEPSFVMWSLPQMFSSRDVTPDIISEFLIKNNPSRSKLLGKEVIETMEDALATSGNIITHHSLSTDSYPLKMSRIAQGVRNGTIVPIRTPYEPGSTIINGIPYQRFNSFGIQNRIKASEDLIYNAKDIPVLDSQGKPQLDGNGKPIFTNKLEGATSREEVIDNGVRRIHYTSLDGEYLGYADVLTDQQTVDLINLQVQSRFRMTPEHKRPAPVILQEGRMYYPQQAYMVRKQGGKILPKLYGFK